MPSAEARQSDLDAVHPSLRTAVQSVLAELKTGKHPFEVFEAFRSPERQASLYAQGRTKPGNKVTKARPWTSYHQYGLAADFVLKIDGQWSWDTSGANAGHWKALHEIARKYGLEPLSWELPHLQMAGLRIADLQRGAYPPFGDDAWADNLEAAIAGWTGAETAPPLPPVAARPPLPAGAEGADAVDPSEVGSPAVNGAGATPMADDNLELNRPATPEQALEAMAMPNQFARIQTYVDKWEGGYVDHPSDPGGATNMGITLATLSQWRGRNVTKAELKALTRAEQRQIMKAWYYDVVRADEMPAAVAALTYNASVLHGPKRSARFLQTALRNLGAPVAVDGAIGRETLDAITSADVASLVNQYLSVQEAFLRSLPHFKTFGKGWMNRLEDVGTFSRSLLSETSLPIADEPVPPAPQPDIGTSVSREPPLTPVNAALGTTVGNLLNGRKTALGVLGAVGATLLPDVAPQLGLMTEGTAVQAAEVINPLALALAGWGVLGKAEKWMAQPPAPVPGGSGGGR